MPSITDQQRPVWNRGAEAWAMNFDGQVTQTVGPMLFFVTGVDFAEDMISVAAKLDACSVQAAGSR